jgi:hypothetical protein
VSDGLATDDEGAVPTGSVNYFVETSEGALANMYPGW